MLFLLYSCPIFSCRLFGFVIAEIIVTAVLECVGQILLVNPMMLIIVSVFIKLTFVGVILAVIMHILQLTGYGACFACGNVLHGGVNCVVSGV